MSLDSPPHRPSEPEVAAARKLKLPSGAEHIRHSLHLCGAALAQNQAEYAVPILRSALRVAPDEPKLYLAYGEVYQSIGNQDAAQLCLDEAKRLVRENATAR